MIHSRGRNKRFYEDMGRIGALLDSVHSRLSLQKTRNNETAPIQSQTAWVPARGDPELVDRKNQLCLEYSMPWLERLALERGLLKFRHLGASKGKRGSEDDRERKLWDVDISLFLPGYSDFLKRVANLRDYLAVLRTATGTRFEENNMWQIQELASWPLKSLHVAFKNLLALSLKL